MCHVVVGDAARLSDAGDCRQKLVEVGEMALFVDVDFIRLDVTHMADSLQQQCNEWITLLGKLLHDIAYTNMTALHAKLKKYSAELITDPSNLEELKAVLQVCPAQLATAARHQQRAMLTPYLILLVRDVIYTSRAYATISLSVCL